MSENNKKGMFLHLFHGREDPEEDMEDWGRDGPYIGPLKYVHTTYLTDIKIEFLNLDDADKFRITERSGVQQEMKVVEDMIEYDGMYYGDWCVELR